MHLSAWASCKSTKFYIHSLLTSMKCWSLRCHPDQDPRLIVPINRIPLYVQKTRYPSSQAQLIEKRCNNRLRHLDQLRADYDDRLRLRPCPPSSLPVHPRLELLQGRLKLQQPRRFLRQIKCQPKQTAQLRDGHSGHKQNTRR